MESDLDLLKRARSYEFKFARIDVVASRPPVPYRFAKSSAVCGSLRRGSSLKGERGMTEQLTETEIETGSPPYDDQPRIFGARRGPVFLFGQ